MWKDFGVKCVNWSIFCILDEYPRAGVDALRFEDSLLFTDKTPFLISGRHLNLNPRFCGLKLKDFYFLF